MEIELGNALLDTRETDPSLEEDDDDDGVAEMVPMEEFWRPTTKEKIKRGIDSRWIGLRLLGWVQQQWLQQQHSSISWRQHDNDDDNHNNDENDNNNNDWWQQHWQQQKFTTTKEMDDNKKIDDKKNWRLQ